MEEVPSAMGKFLLPSPNLAFNRMLSSSSSSSAGRPPSPRWLRGASKLLDNGFDGEDWKALADLLGYKAKRLDQMEETLQPSRALFQDWLSSSGNTKLSIEMLCACLEEIKRHDVVEIIMEFE